MKSHGGAASQKAAAALGQAGITRGARTANHCVCMCGTPFATMQGGSVSEKHYCRNSGWPEQSNDALGAVVVRAERYFRIGRECSMHPTSRVPKRIWVGTGTDKKAVECHDTLNESCRVQSKANTPTWSWYVRPVRSLPVSRRFDGAPVFVVLFRDGFLVFIWLCAFEVFHSRVLCFVLCRNRYTIASFPQSVTRAISESHRIGHVCCGWTDEKSFWQVNLGLEEGWIREKRTHAVSTKPRHRHWRG